MNVKISTDGIHNRTLMLTPVDGALMWDAAFRKERDILKINGSQIRGMLNRWIPEGILFASANNDDCDLYYGRCATGNFELSFRKNGYLVSQYTFDENDVCLTSSEETIPKDLNECLIDTIMLMI